MPMSSDSSQATTVFFCRHGETDWNLAKRFQGRIDIPLNDAGGQQAQQIAETLCKHNLAVVWASPLSRARNTAVAIAAAAGVELKLDNRLLERELGVLQGFTASEIRQEQPKAWAAWKTRGLPFPPDSNVEPGTAVVERVESALFELAAAYPGKAVAVVGHGAALKCVLTAAVGTASISVLRVGPGRSWCIVGKPGLEGHLKGLRGLGFFKDADAEEWGEDQNTASATTVLLCRHGETDWNLDRKFQGIVDIPLNDLGRKQATIISQALEHKNISAVWTSPLKRAHETGEMVASAIGIPLQVDERLRERNLGVMQGRNPTELREQFPAVIDAWVSQTPLPPEANAEADHDVVSRIEGAMFDLAQAYPGKTVALILHGASVRCLLKRAVGGARIKTPKNVSLTTLAVGPGRDWRIVKVADVSHMPKMTREELVHKLRGMPSKL